MRTDSLTQTDSVDALTVMYVLPNEQLTRKNYSSSRASLTSSLEAVQSQSAGPIDLPQREALYIRLYKE